MRKELPLGREQDRQDEAEGGLSSTITLCPLSLATALTFPLLGWPLSNVSTALTFTLSLVQHSGFSVPKKSGKAKPGSSCSGNPSHGGLYLVVLQVNKSWCEIRKQTWGVGVGTELWELVCPQPGLCNLKFGRAGPRAAEPRAELAKYLRGGRTELETWNRPHCSTECLVCGISCRNELTSHMFQHPTPLILNFTKKGN